MSAQPPEPVSLQQEPGESCDFFAMRAFLVALMNCDDNRARAMIQWIADRGFNDLIRRKREAEQSAAPHTGSTKEE